MNRWLAGWRKTLNRRSDRVHARPIERSAGVESSPDEAEWDAYWNLKKGGIKAVYDVIAVFYRIFLIRPLLNHVIRREFALGAQVLHAGCGGGQVDSEAVRRLRLTALDISMAALERYKKIHGGRCTILHGSMLTTPFPDGFFDGIYNLGVMEHYSEERIAMILAEFKRVLKPEAKIVLFWPPKYGVSVLFLKGIHLILNRVMKKNIALHPAEVTQLRSREHARGLIESAGFELMRYDFGPLDMFTNVVVVGRKPAAL